MAFKVPLAEPQPAVLPLVLVVKPLRDEVQLGQRATVEPVW